tara:strand:- start:598 stop:780 length:183 start_codon:yes stop_codon:yes gene_type:complete
MKALITEDIKPNKVNGFDLLLNKGSSNATKPPAIIEIKYLGYLETLEKNSPIGSTIRLLF